MVALLREFERAQDHAFALGGELAAALVPAQLEQKLHPSVGQAAFVAFTQALAQLTAARGHTVEGHKAVEKIGGIFGIDVQMDDGDGFGDSYKYPSARRSGVAADRRAA